MVAGDDDAPPEARPAGLDDLVFLCRALNEAGARYVVIGGMAIIEAGFVRATEDIDLLVEASPQNLARVRTAMMALPDGAVRDVADGDLDAYVVVRVADEFVVDLMKAACGVEYERARHFINWVEIEGVSIPFANVDLLWETKQTVREKDRLDRHFLESLRANRGDDETS